MLAHARLKYYRISTRKMRIVADLIRGKNVEEALNILIFCKRRAADILLRLLRSAIANAEEQQFNPEELYVSVIFVDQGPMMKRFSARARRRAAIIRHRMSHATIELDSKDQPEDN
jgi:large subunit ribosomal protein L22